MCRRRSPSVMMPASRPAVVRRRRSCRVPCATSRRSRRASRCRGRRRAAGRPRASAARGASGACRACRPGCRLAKSSCRNPLRTSSAIASASPSASAAVVLAVGARFSGQASSFDAAVERRRRPPGRAWSAGKPVIAIIRAPTRRIVSSSRRISPVSPPYDSATITSSACRAPRSPWIASAGWRKNAGVPVLDERRRDLPADDARLAHAGEEHAAAAVLQEVDRPREACRRAGRRGRRIASASMRRTWRASSMSVIGVGGHHSAVSFTMASMREQAVGAARRGRRGGGRSARRSSPGPGPRAPRGRRRPRPAATPAEPSGSMYCARPAVTPSPPPGSCRLCVTSKIDGVAEFPHHREGPHVHDQVVVAERRAALGDEHPLVAGAGDLRDRVADVARGEELALLDVHGAARCAAAATSRSVWRQRNAGICRTSATSAAGAACDGLVDVGQDGHAQVRLDPRRGSGGPRRGPGPRYERDRRPVRLVVGRLEDERARAWRAAISRMAAASPAGVRLALDDAGPGDEDERAAAADARWGRSRRSSRRPLYVTALRGQPGGACSDPSPPARAGPLSRRVLQPAAVPPPPGLQPLQLVAVARADEAGEQRVRAQRLRLELGVELHGDEPRVAGQFGDLDELAVGRLARDPQAVRGEDRLVGRVELVAVAVPLEDASSCRRRVSTSEPGARSHWYCPRRIVPPRSSTPSRSRSL